jgi:hypothetical protein
MTEVGFKTFFHTKIFLALGEAFKKALFERIEDEYDITVAKDAYDDYVKDGCKSRPISKLWEELDL